MIGLLVTWCTKTQQVDTHINTGNVVVTTGSEDLHTWQQYTIISWAASSEYLPWYTGDVVIITNENSGAVVLIPNEQLLYRNELYWFQVLLGKDWKGGKICESSDLHKDAKSVWFFLSWDFAYPNYRNQNTHPDTTWCRPIWYVPWGDIAMYTYDNFDILNNSVNMDWTTWNIQHLIITKNNMYYFLGFLNIYSDWRVHQTFPDYPCKEEEYSDSYGSWVMYICPWFEEYFFLDGFSVFDVK